jgi:flagellar motor switch protein FliM
MIVSTQLMREPWKNVLEINPVLERIETNPQFAQVIAPNEMIAIVTLNMKIGDVEGFMNVCLPYFTLENIMDRLNTKYWFSTMQDSSADDYQLHIESLIKRVDIPVKVIMGQSKVSVNDFINLMPGDIIRLDSQVDSELDIYVGNIRKFKAVPGTNKDKYAAQITKIIREEE